MLHMTDPHCHSRFWITPEDYSSKSNSIIRSIFLAKIQRAVSQFVYILTGKNILVTYPTCTNISYTDGNRIVISGNPNKPGLDVLVGTALHEASHIVTTDFNVLKDIFGNTSEKTDVTTKMNIVLEKSKDAGLTYRQTVDFIKLLVNVIEDRRIDYWAVENYKGYRNYYLALYDYYFNSKAIKEAYDSEKFNNQTLECWEFHLINVASKYKDENAIKGLRGAYALIDLQNIHRLKSTYEVFVLACKVFVQHVLPNLEIDEGKCNKPDDVSDGDDTDLDGFEKSKQFTNGGSKKIAITKSQKNYIDIVQNNKTDILSDDSEKFSDISTVVIHGLNTSIISNTKIGVTSLVSKYSSIVKRGIHKGEILARSLKLLETDIITQHQYRKTGNVCRRNVYRAGFNDENIFQRFEIETIPTAHIHLSIDASGSMEGNKWTKALEVATSLAWASTKLSKLHVIISLRGIIFSDNSHADCPLLLVAFDSKKDNPNIISKYFSFLDCRSCTPEGLCFRNIESLCVSNNEPTWFINISDGIPEYLDCHGNSYSGKEAVQHTKTQVDHIRSLGIKVISYFVSGDNNHKALSPIKENFTRMYGADAQFIDVDNLNQLIYSINKDFAKHKTHEFQ